MRGKSDSQPPMFFAICVEDRVRADHPLRPIKRMVDEELSRMSRRFDAAYADTGRPGVPPERLLKALLLQSLYSVRSESQLCERINTDLLFRWFLDMDPAEPMFDATAGSDKGYDSGPYYHELEKRGVTPHSAMRSGPIGGATRRKKKHLPLIQLRKRMARRLRTRGYQLRQRCRKKIEEAFGWIKTVAGMCRTRLVGRWKIKQQFQLAAAAYNLVRIRKLAT